MWCYFIYRGLCRRPERSSPPLYWQTIIYHRPTLVSAKVFWFAYSNCFFFRAWWVTLLLGVLFHHWATIQRVLPTIWFLQTFTWNLRWVWFLPCVDVDFNFQFYKDIDILDILDGCSLFPPYINKENFFWFCYDSLPRTRLLRQKVFKH